MNDMEQRVLSIIGNKFTVRLQDLIGMSSADAVNSLLDNSTLAVNANNEVYLLNSYAPGLEGIEVGKSRGVTDEMQSQLNAPALTTTTFQQRSAEGKVQNVKMETFEREIGTEKVPNK